MTSIKIIQILRSLGGLDVDQNSYHDDIFSLPKSMNAPTSLVELLKNLLQADVTKRWSVEKCMQSAFFSSVSFDELREGRSPSVCW